jgi:MbtH protein
MDMATSRYAVLVNDEEQYALYPAERDTPPGWQPAGFAGSEQDCVQWVDTHWTDMRPLSVRRAASA